MVLSNEPGFYVAGEYGIRIENLFEIVESGDGYLRFQTLSMIPISTAPVLRDRLTSDEISWLNDYHALVREKLSPIVPAELSDYLGKVTAVI